MIDSAIERDAPKSNLKIMKSILESLGALAVGFLLYKGYERIMAQIDDLKAAIAAETVAIQAVATAVTDETTRVEAVIAALKALGGSNPDLAQAITDLQTHVSSLGTVAAALALVEPVPVTPVP